MLFLKPVILIAGGVVVAALLQAGWALLRAPAGEYRLNKQRIPFLLAPLRGTILTQYDGVRDFRSRAGLAVNRRTNEWVDQGTLSEEALDSVLRR